ncbi:MAG: YcxB family protein [Acidobacteriaceae bacterium]
MAFTTSGLEMRGKLNATEAAETERFLRSRLTRVRMGVRWIYVGFFLVFLAWLGITGVLHFGFVNTFRTVVPVSLPILGVVGILIYQLRRARAKAGRVYNSAAPDRFRLNPTELSWESTDGTKGSAPWAAYRGWREGKTVIFLLTPDKNRVVILPKTDVSVVDLEMVRGTLGAALGPVRGR